MNQSLWESDRVRGAVSQSSHRPAMHRDKILIRYMYTVEFSIVATIGKEVFTNIEGWPISGVFSQISPPLPHQLIFPSTGTPCTCRFLVYIHLVMPTRPRYASLGSATSGWVETKAEHSSSSRCFWLASTSSDSCN